MTMNHDLTNEKTGVRQRKMMFALRRTGFGSFIRAEFPKIILHPAFCQLAARDLRQSTHERAKRLFEILGNNTLSFATWVPREAVSSEPLPLGPDHLVKRFAEAAATTPITAIAAATEIDYVADRKGWQSTVHAIVRHPKPVKRSVLSKDLAVALGSAKRRDDGVYRPLLLKPVHDLDGLISYVFKDLSVLSTTQRSPWRDPEGRPRSVKQSLRTPQLRQLLEQTKRDGVKSRIFIGFFDEVVR